MSKIDVYKHFMKPLLQVFKPSTDALDPKTGDRQAWIEAYKLALDGFSEEALFRASRALISSRENPFFPLPAECIAMCREATAGIVAQKRGQHRTRQHADRDDWERRTKIADELFAQCPDAKQSLDGEWWWRLHSWIAKEQRLPDQHELRQIEAKGKADYAQYLEDITGNIYAKLLQNWRNIAYSRIKSLLERQYAE